jgi:1-phosphatidylinositol phosphodiesterase
MGETWTTDWMKGVPNTVPISEVSIPGTHDSCARRATLDSICQAGSITSQLNRGIRFLDIRCDYQGAFANTYAPYVFFTISHGYFQFITFEEVQAQCIAFLLQNPSECILMNVQMVSGKSAQFYQKFQELIGPYKEYWYLEDTVPTMEHCRRKIVLIRAWDANAKAGWDIPTGAAPCGLVWAGFNTNGLTQNGHFTTQNQSAFIGNGPKFELVTDYITKAVNARDGQIYLNFVSHDTFPKPNADNLNPRVADWLLNSVAFGTLVGVIIIDWTSNTGDSGHSLESLIIQHQRHYVGYSFGGIRPGTLLNP